GGVCGGGRVDACIWGRVSRPCGTLIFIARNPPLKRRAISNRPLRGLERSTFCSFSRSPAAAGSRPVALRSFSLLYGTAKAVPLRRLFQRTGFMTARSLDYALS